MNIEQIRARLGEIAGLLAAIKPGTEGFTEDQKADVKKLNGEYENLNSQLETLESQEATLAKAQASARKTSPTNPAPQAAIIVGPDRATERFGGFKSSGDFMMGVKDAAQGNVPKVFQSAAYEKNGDDGGFLVPQDIADGILKKLDAKESLFAGTTQLKCSGNGLTIPVDESQPWNSGVIAYWMAEGGPFTQSKPDFKMVEFKLKKLGALVVATDELLEDATALESYIKMAAPDAIMHKINDSIISGNGVGKPSGILNSGFKIQASKESMQTADTINAKNIINMYARMLPIARAGAAWYINAGAEAQLLGLKDDNDNYIYLAPGSQMNQSPYGLLLGRPVYPMMSSMQALGDAGDIAFMNLAYYYTLTKQGQGVKSAQSIHAYFDTEKTAFRFSLRIDGRVPFQTPVAAQYGSHTASGFVTLEAR